MKNIPTVTVSENWQYEDLALIVARGQRHRGEQAVVVRVAEDDVRIFSWK